MERKKILDPYVKKEWYEVKVPASSPDKLFYNQTIGRTMVTKTSGTKIAKDNLLGRVFEVSLGDLKVDVDDEAFRKFRYKVEDVQGAHCLTTFNGMTITTDKLRSLVRKWQTLIEAHTEVKTSDGYLLRVFCIGFTKRRSVQLKKTAYAQTSQVRAIRKKMFEIIAREVSKVDLAQFVDRLMAETIGREIEKATSTIFPLVNVLVRKVKVLRGPKFDLHRLLEQHGIQELKKVEETVPQPVKTADLGAPVKGAKGKGKGKGKKEEEEQEEAAEEEEAQ